MEIMNTTELLQFHLGRHGVKLRAVDEDVLSFEHVLSAQGVELPTTGLVWLNESTLQIRIPVPITLDPSQTERALCLALRLNGVYMSGYMAYYSNDEGMFHACVSTRRSESGISQEDASYCFENAVEMASAFADVLIRCARWEAITAGRDQNYPEGTVGGDRIHGQN